MWAVVQLLSHIWLFVTLWTAVHQASLSFTISWSFFKLMCIESVMPSSYLILCQPLLLPSIFPSIRSFPMSRLQASGGQSIGASTSVFPMNIQGWFPSGLTLGFDLLAVQGTLKSLFQHHCLKASVAFSLLYDPNLTSVHDYWKNYSFDSMDHSQQSDVSAF